MPPTKASPNRKTAEQLTDRISQHFERVQVEIDAERRKIGHAREAFQISTHTRDTLASEVYQLSQSVLPSRDGHLSDVRQDLYFAREEVMRLEDRVREMGEEQRITGVKIKRIHDENKAFKEVAKANLEVSPPCRLSASLSFMLSVPSL